MKINKSWDLRELVYNLRALKQEYEEVLAFFLSCENYKERNKYIKETRDNFYSLNLKEWQIDLCWEYMNDYKLFPEIISVFKRIDKQILK